jgi:preprotein translocase subunit SecB
MSNYKLLSVTLTESHLKRKEKVHFGENEAPIEIGINFEKNENNLYSIVSFQINDNNEEKPIGLEVTITMVGEFLIEGEPLMPIEQFASINAPAIIFPFIREHLASLTMKAGINPPILLPPINFVKMAEEQKIKFTQPFIF